MEFSQDSTPEDLAQKDAQLRAKQELDSVPEGKEQRSLSERIDSISSRKDLHRFFDECRRFDD